ncbi:MAG TPA: hypothetical protein VM865_08340 [Acidobacteriaceae bacterium]|jgi:glucose/arabinose dehydrogenase|nr:hypothetical protein [Acidobacteriaceae bacterium]
MPLSKFASIAFAAALFCTPALRAQSPLQPHTLTYAPGKTITLSLPAPLEINVAASGLRRVRFLAQSPDGRIFATGMYNLADNTRGAVYILDGWDAKTHSFTRVTHYLDHLRNPNNLAFWTDPATHQSWLYLPLTERLVRFRYTAGDTHPTSDPETLIRFPDYGLNYKYGGWHLTRTVAIATLRGATRLYVAAGSSCNYCKEREVLRAAVVSMKPDGTDQRIVAQGLRNAVDLRFLPELDKGSLFATNMGDDHLGDRLPEDTVFELDADSRGWGIGSVNTGPDGASPCGAAANGCVTVLPFHYGWPTCYFAGGKPIHDTTPLPVMPPPGDLASESERPAGAGPPSHSRSPESDPDSPYGAQPGMATAGTNLTAGGGQASRSDPNAKLGHAPAPLSSCEQVPAAYTTFSAHSSPLGLSYFGADNAALRNTFLVALHGASHPRIGTGYRLVRFTAQDRTPRDFLTGFLTVDSSGRPQVHGRPCGLLRLGPDTFLLTDDFLGLVYYIHPQGR